MHSICKIEYDSYSFNTLVLHCDLQFWIFTITMQKQHEAAAAATVVRLIYEAHIKTTPFISNTNRNYTMHTYKTTPSIVRYTKHGNVTGFREKGLTIDVITVPLAFGIRIDAYFGQKVDWWLTFRSNVNFSNSIK